MVWLHSGRRCQPDLYSEHHQGPGPGAHLQRVGVSSPQHHVVLQGAGPYWPQLPALQHPDAAQWLHASGSKVSVRCWEFIDNL